MVEQPQRFRVRPGSTPRSQSRPTVRAAARALWLAAVLLLGAAATSGPAAAAGGAGTPLKLAATLPFKAPVAAVAINADESLIATALAGSGATTVVISDRRSKGVLGQISSPVGGAPRLRFSPVGDLLLVAGKEALQLWEVPIAPLKPGRPLPEKHLRWSVALDEDAPLGAMAFGTAPGAVVWSAGNALYQRAVTAGSPAPAEPGWQAEGEGPLGFALAGGRLAVFGGGGKALALLDSRTFADQGTLTGHRFPVVAAAYAGGALVSLDAGYNLVRWTAGGQPEFTGYPGIPQGSPAPMGLLPVAGPHYLILPGGGGNGLLVDVAGGASKGTLPLGGSGQVAVSPTGRYLLTAEGNAVRLFTFAQPLAVRAYVERLKRLNAPATARNYVNMLDPSQVSDKLRAELLAALERAAPAVGLEDYLTSLATAEEEGNLDGMVYWAGKILALDPNHPQARAALERVKEIRETELLTGAQRALEAGEARQAISMLSEGISSGSPRYPEALQLIRQAEGARGVQTALEQAREKMNMANYPAAKAIVSDVLRKDSENPTALALRDEISERSGETPFEPLTLLFVAVLGMALIGGGLFLLRNLLAPFLRRASLQEREPLRRPLGKGRAREQAPPEPGPRPRAAPREGTVPPRPDANQREQRRAAEALFAKTEEMLRLAHQRDVQQQHSSLLLELEAELNAMHRRMMERTAELDAVSRRLEVIGRQVGGLKFGKPAAPQRVDAGATYYDILRLRPDATAEEIKVAYHRMLKEYHPDLHSQSSFGWVRAEAEKMSRKISEAYEVLSDSAKRDRYNRTLQRKGG